MPYNDMISHSLHDVHYYRKVEYSKNCLNLKHMLIFIKRNQCPNPDKTEDWKRPKVYKGTSDRENA